MIYVLGFASPVVPGYSRSLNSCGNPDKSVPKVTTGISDTSKIRVDVNECDYAITNLTVVDRDKIGFCFAVTAQDFEGICIVVPFALGDLGIEGRNVQFFTLRRRVTSETRRVQTFSITRTPRYKQNNSGQSPHSSHKISDLPRHSASRERSVPSILSHNLSIGGKICWAK